MTASFSQSKIMAWGIWLLVSIFYAYQYILRVMPNVMLGDIMQQFSMDAAIFGQFSGIYYIGYSLMHLPIGIFLDRYGARNVMTASILLTVVGLTPLLFTEHWFYPILGRLLMGMGSSAAILGLFKMIRMTFAEDKFPRMLSLSVMIGLMGAIYGGTPLAYMKEGIGYLSVVQIFAFLGLLLAAATYMIVPSQKEERTESIFSSIKEVLGNYRVMASCFFAGLMVGPLEGFADVWGTAFLREVYHFEGGMATSLPSMIFVGMCFGAPILSFIADKAGNFLGTVAAAGGVMALVFFLMIQSTMTPSTISVSFIIVGICCAYQILAIYKISTYVRAEVAGLATAVANMIIMIFGYGFHSMIGSIVLMMGGPSESQALIYGISTIPVALATGTFGFMWMMIQEKRQIESA